MKTINKIFSVLGVSLALGLSACVSDLDRLPIDPNELTADKFADDPETYIMQVMAKCYSGMAVSGQTGPDGDSDISGLDGGTSQYTRALYMLNEFTTDESLWIWQDEGVVDLVTNTWGTANANIYGTYSRLYVHIAICNDFLRLMNNLGDYGISPDDELQATIDQYKLEARALRAMSYYWAIDLFGNASFIDETSDAGTNPVQYTRQELYDWLAAELEDLVDSFPDTTPIYGRVGKDGVEALLARLYLNASVYTDGAVTDGYTKCAEHCENIINRHKGGGYNGSGLAEHYLYLFCRDNDEYMPGGGNTAENEILWGIPYHNEYVQPYGGTRFLIASCITDIDDGSSYMRAADYGLSAGWTCMHARPEFANKFDVDATYSTDGDNDVRWSMWAKEDAPDDNGVPATFGFTRENTAFSTFTNGYASVKFTNLYKGTNGEWSAANGGIYANDGSDSEVTTFPDTDLPLIRLADVYLMYAESYIVGGAGNATNALEYVNYVRGRAGVQEWVQSDMTADNILDERARELYHELTRRSDLIRHNKYASSNYNWSWKYNQSAGASFPSYMELFPIPANVLAAQSDFEQNPGY